MAKKGKSKLKPKAKSWRAIWAERIDAMSSLNGLAESLKENGDKPLKIDRTPSAWWKNHAS